MYAFKPIRSSDVKVNVGMSSKYCNHLFLVYFKHNLLVIKM